MNKEVLDFMKTYAKNHGMKFSVKKNLEAAGVCLPYLRSFELADYLVDWTDEDALSVFFHEAMHVRCYEEGVYPLYNGNWCNKNRAKIRSQAWRAEKHVDHLAKEEMKNYFPDLKYDPAYIGRKNLYTRKLIVKWI